MLRRVVRHFARDRKANVAIIFALMMVPIIFLLGMTLDYTLALRKREQLDAAADAAAIAAERPSMLTQTDAAAVRATAEAVFAAKANLPGLSSAPTPTVTVTDSGLARTITVAYTAQSINNFPRRSRQADLAGQRLRHGAGVQRAEHELLFAVGRVSVDGPWSDAGRHRQDDYGNEESAVICEKLCVRLP